MSYCNAAIFFGELTVTVNFTESPTTTVDLFVVIEIEPVAASTLVIDIVKIPINSIKIDNMFFRLFLHDVNISLWKR